MFAIKTAGHDPAPSRQRRHRPVAERLEDRLLLYSTLGAEWAHGSRITYSFTPDGTDVGGVPSSWIQRMDQLGISETAWKDQFRRAAATWASIANINMVEVPDDGSPLSVAGNQQGDARFGDIRITGINLGTGVLGSAFLPPSINGGTLAGDIVMNASAYWSVGTTYDIQTVALHEFGHALGLDHATQTAPVMYSSYTNVKQTLSSDDTAGIRSIYGARQPDALEGPSNNNLFTRATDLTPYLGTSFKLAIPDLDIQAATDADWYSIIVPNSSTSTMTVTMQSSNLSSLSPGLQVFDASLRGLAQDVAPNTYGSTVSVSLSGVSPGQKYYFRAMAANNGPTGAGGYGLLVNFSGSTQSPIAPPNTTVSEELNQYGGGQGSMSLGAADHGVDPDHDLSNEQLRIGGLNGFGDSFLISGKVRGGKPRYATESVTIVPSLNPGERPGSALFDFLVAIDPLIKADSPGKALLFDTVIQLWGNQNRDNRAIDIVLRLWGADDRADA